MRVLSVSKLFAVAAMAVVLVISMAAMPAQAGRRKPPKTPDRYTPATGVQFNTPIGNEAEQRVLFTHIIRTINSSPRGSTIRFAVYSFADPAISRALLAAHRRGVRVKLVFSGSNIYPPMRRVMSALGTNPNRRSFAMTCKGSCRGVGGDMHAKYFSFSQAGSARWITMVGSNNLTKYNAQRQWNDLYTRSDDYRLFLTFREWFTQLKADVPVLNPYISVAVGNSALNLTPVGSSILNDPIAQALASVTCEDAGLPGSGEPNGGTGSVQTKVMIATHAWNDLRGRNLARDVASLAQEGCDVTAILGVGVGPTVTNTLESAGVRIVKSKYPGVDTHQKLLIVRGEVDGATIATRVWTGSSNWSDAALKRDDIILKITDEAIGQQYIEGFERMIAVG